MFKERINLFTFCYGICYCGFWFGVATSMIGEYTKGPYLITWWDAVWIPMTVAVFPFLLGFLSRKHR